VGAAVSIANQVGGVPGQALATAARGAFVDALGIAAVVAAAIAVATAVVIGRTMPARGAEHVELPSGPAGEPRAELAGAGGHHG
jgi:hypothetical protein